MIIQPIVEGPGDVLAVPVLLQRLCYELNCCLGARIATPMKVPRSKILNKDHFVHYLRIANSQPGCKLVLLFIDADDDCAIKIAGLIRPWIAEQNISAACEIVVIPREYECWFIASMESLRGVHGISEAAYAHKNPERVRNPKAIITKWMEGSAAYHETADQAAFTSKMDLDAVRTQCKCFRRLMNKLTAACS